MRCPPNQLSILVLLIIWRLISVYVVQTFHVPDEYWQSLEVAHRLAFGYGYLTWEWQAKIRSYIYPFLISILYRILAVLGLDSVMLLTNVPRIFQALISGYADYRFYIWTRSKWALLSISTNWFWYYCATRTLANSLETALTTIALSIFPWPGGNSRGYGFLWIVGFLTTTRPTAAVLWTPLCIYHIYANSKRPLEMIKKYVLIGSATFFYSVLIDSLCYGTFVITPWEFFKVNILNSIAEFYGTHNFLWYFIVGLPVVLGLQAFIFPLAALGAFRDSFSRHQDLLMIAVTCWTLIVYSALPHKEFRFILSLLPILIRISTNRNNIPLSFRITEFRRKIFLGVFIISNLLPGLYICLIHQRGSLDVMRLLQSELKIHNATSKDLMFLTPCHSTPLYSHLHINVPIKFLTCEPNLNNLPNYLDEAYEFFQDPMLWLNTKIEKNNNFRADILVVFDNLSPKIIPFLKNYRLLAKVFHAHFPQSNYGEYIEVYKHK
ncbi:GPI mannosyltransferase 3 [Venturia canescens]|uniref:GPI mannosyltransferase 3 n=1 Tax=Venturia canescens TaxID=32260 RepID=UPI001C9D234F|nr:GPI mannosyltransferase 3 [Venturia canescens]